MKIYQVTDTHLKNEEPFFKAGVALDNFILEQLEKETDEFVYLDGGDRFHVSKETGRVNGEVVKFLLSVAKLKNCISILSMQGNHDVGGNTGSALDVIRNLHPKIIIVDEPFIVDMNTKIIEESTDYVYLLPHMRPFSKPGYSGIKSYGNEEFHQEFWKAQGRNWNDIKNRIKMVSVHGGDETTGKLFMNVDISFLPGIRSNGHIHKWVSINHLPSAAVTRRDEIDKKCFIRYINTLNWDVQDVEIPLFLNYARISYGEDIDKYFESGIHVMPKESLIVDIYGHDDESIVFKEYTEKWAGRQNPKFYIGEVIPVERKGMTVSAEERDDLDISSINIKELFREFCEEKKLSQTITNDLLTRLG